MENEYKVKVISALYHSDLLDQLAEECCELAQACLKLKRAKTFSNNPTPIDFETAMANVYEEVNDVLLCMDSLSYLPEGWDTSCNPKWKRWAERLEKREEL